jgi:hypothetical protein
MEERIEFVEVFASAMGRGMAEHEQRNIAVIAGITYGGQI